MALTPEDIAKLEAPLPLEHHEARAKGKNKAGNQQQWLIYITQEGVIPLLNSIDPSWTWEVKDSAKWDKYAVVTGQLTVKGVFRDGRGGSSPNIASASTHEDTEKGAETDALKRAAVKFGVGLYLRGLPAIWLPYSDSNKPWEDEKLALDKFANWYRQAFGGKPAPAPKAPVSPPSTHVSQKTGDDFAKQFPAASKWTADMLYDAMADYFNNQHHFKKHMEKHAAEYEGLTLEEAEALVRRLHWNWDKDRVTALCDWAKATFGMDAKEVAAALGVKVFRDWERGDYAEAQAACHVWADKQAEKDLAKESVGK